MGNEVYFLKIYNLLGCLGSFSFRYKYRVLVCLQIDVYLAYGAFNVCPVHVH